MAIALPSSFYCLCHDCYYYYYYLEWKLARCDLPGNDTKCIHVSGKGVFPARERINDMGCRKDSVTRAKHKGGQKGPREIMLFIGKPMGRSITISNKKDQYHERANIPNLRVPQTKCLEGRPGS